MPKAKRDLGPLLSILGTLLQLFKVTYIKLEHQGYDEQVRQQMVQQELQNRTILQVEYSSVQQTVHIVTQVGAAATVGHQRGGQTATSKPG